MIYTAIDTFYLTDEQLKNSPSRKDGIDEETETTLRVYGCDLIQESGILLRLPQAVMATGQVLFHRFYCKKSFARFDVKRVAASCVWLASKLEESPRRAKHVLMVFHRMECRRENLPIELLDVFSKKYTDLKMELIRSERHILKEMGFICHVEHPHKFISNYLVTLGTPPDLRQHAWNLANDSLRTTLCVRFKSEVVACGVVYAAARRFGVPLPENPPWWKVFDADKCGIDEVCRVLAHLYSRPKATYIPVCKEPVSFTASNKAWDSHSKPLPKEGSLGTAAVNDDTTTKTASVTEHTEGGGSKDALVNQVLDKRKGSKKSDDESNDAPFNGDGREEHLAKSKELKAEIGGERSRDREREEKEKDRNREKDKDKGRDLREKLKSRDRERRRDPDRERDDSDRDKAKDRVHRSRDRVKDLGSHSDKGRHHSSRDRDCDRDYYGYSSREKDRHRHHKS